tara:strand:+ start:16 stop:339 length:324 start_codon:yes stop_codon:yes gene_type:complete
MKVIEYEGNVQDCSFTYHRTREGPNFFVSHYKGSTKGHNDPKECWRTLGVAKFTDSGKALKEWCLSMDEQYGLQEAEKAEAEGRSDTSFASEALEEESPTDNTKMVT